MSLKIGHKILLLISIPLIFVLIVIALFAIDQRNTELAAAGADRSDVVLDQTHMLWATMLDAEDNERGYLLTHNPLYLDRFRGSELQIPTLLTKLQQLVGADSGREDGLDALAIATYRRLHELHNFMARGERPVGSASETGSKQLEGSGRMDELRSRVTAFNDDEIRIDARRDAKLAQSLDTTNKLFVICGIAAFALSLLVWQVFSRILVRRLADLGDEARAFSEGGTLKKTVEKGDDEISQLHRSFQTMAEAIVEKQTVLARYQLLAKTARDIILFVARDDLRILDANDAAVRAYGYERAELLSMTLRDIRAPESLAGLDDELKRTDAGPMLFETRHRRKDRSTFPVEVASRATVIDGNQVLLSVVRDITERKNAENEHEKFFDRSNDLMGVVTFEGYLSRINSAWESALGHSTEELTRTPFMDFVHPDDRERSILMTGALGRGEPLTSFENRIAKKDGSYVWLSWSAIPSKEEGLVYAVARDVTKRREIEAELAYSRDQAMAASLIKSQFLANMSHEIRTPMNGIVASSELLLRSSIGGDEREYAGMISESAHALLIIINEILDLSKLEAGKMDLETTEYAPLAVVDSAASVLAIQAAQRGLSLQTHVDGEVPKTLLGDATRVRQVLLNLLGNAVKFTERGTVSLRVSKEVEDATHITLRFTVADTGIGLSQQEREMIFEPFTQGDGSTSRRYGGTGLGLSICKRLVELMDGQIGVKSEQGTGSTFWFTARMTKVEAGVRHGADALLRDRRMLIVDSDLATCDTIARFAKSWSVRSATTSSVDAVIPLLLQGQKEGDPFHFLIVDLSTAGVDVWRLSEAVANDATLVLTKVILATSREASEDLHAEGRFAAFLQKPVRQSQLHDCILTAMDAADPKPLVHGLQELLPGQLSSAQIRPRGSVGARVLLAEDHAINRRIALAQLKELGIDVDVAVNGQEAIDAYERHRYDVILMDCQMPDVDGFAATRAIRAIQARDGGSVRIIAMTANAMEGDRRTCIEAGMDDYLSKPVEIDRLRDALLQGPARPPSPIGGAPVEGFASVLDFARLRQVFHDDVEAMREVFEIGISECRPLAAEIQIAVARREGPTAVQAAHKFKGICGNVGANELASIGLRIERAAKSADWPSAQDGCCDLDAGLSRFVTAASTHCHTNEALTREVS